MENEERKLTDADVVSIVEQLERRVTERFYKDLGRGVWALAWKTIVIGLIALAAYGAASGRH